MNYVFEKHFAPSYTPDGPEVYPSDPMYEVFGLSNSLGGSDLGYFIDCDTYADLENTMTEAKANGSMADFSLTKCSDSEWTFSYSTVSHINSLTLIVNNQTGIKAYYGVQSHHSLRDSSIAATMLQAGWKLQPVDMVQQKNLEQEEDNHRIEELLKDLEKGNLHMMFIVRFSIDNGGLPSIVSRFIETDPTEDIKRLALRPDLAADIRKVAENQLERKLEFPRLYEYNDEIRSDSNWFEERFKEYRLGLETLIASCKYQETLNKTKAGPTSYN